MDSEPNDRLDLDRLCTRLREKPRTKADQVRQAWPEIKALFEAGHSLKYSWTWLNEIGIEIGHARLSYYTGQLKRRDRAFAERRSIAEAGVNPDNMRSDDARSIDTTFPSEPSGAEHAGDPLANVREREHRSPGFQYNAEPDPKKLI